MDMIGISEDRLHHILGVARKCYEIAKERSHNEEFCQRMFMIGWVHDVGYEFVEKQSEHPAKSSELLHNLVSVHNLYDTQISLKTDYAIHYHGQFPDKELLNNEEWIILNMADMLIDSTGNEVTVEERLEDIKVRYGDKSKQYLDAHNICKIIGLIEN